MRKLKLVNPDGSTSDVHAYDATGRDLHIDAPLSNILINYRPAESIVDKIFPIVPVAKQSDVYFTFDQGDLWRIPDTVRAPLTAAKMADFNVSSDTYFAKNYALATGISIEDAMNADQILNLRQNKAQFIADILMLDWENRVATTVINTSNVGTFTGPQSGVWGEHAAGLADAVNDIDLAIEEMRQRSGYRPTHMVIGWEAWRHVKRHSDVRNLIFPSFAGGATGPGVPSIKQFADLFEIPNVMLGGIMRNTAAEGLADTLADVWGPHVLIYYSPGRPSKETPAYGYTFRWQRPGLPNMTVENLGFDKRLKGEIMDIGFYQDEKIVASNLATVIGSVV